MENGPLEQDRSIDKRTKRALLWMNLSGEPLIILYTLLPFILRKDLNASLLQISLLSALRPVLPVFSFYWSSGITNQMHRLRSNLMGAWALARIPFLLVPWFHNVWYLIFCCAMYELFNKSGIPALIEILNINISKKSREKTYSFYFVLSFLESILLGLFMAGLFDSRPSTWPIVCGCSALVGLSGLLVQLRIPVPPKRPTYFPPVTPAPLERICRPWKDAFALLRKHSEFARFQREFMIGGFGLMLMAPALSVFYVNRLRLDHSDLVAGRSILMGIGIVLSSPVWSKLLSKKPPSTLTRKILIGFASFPILLLLAQYHIGWFYLSFIGYGIAQAGSHLLWNLSGTLFAGAQEDSSPFSRVNILMVGLRGAIAPALGGLLCNFFGPIPLLASAASICLIGASYGILSQKKTDPTTAVL